MPPELNNTKNHELNTCEATVFCTLPPNRRTLGNESKSDLFRPASHLDCLDRGALLVAGSVAIMFEGNDATKHLTLSPGSVTVVSPKCLRVHCRSPEASLRSSSQRKAVLLFTAGLDWALEISGTFSCIGSSVGPQRNHSDCILFDVQLYGVGYRGVTGPGGPPALPTASTADLQALPTLAQIAQEVRP